MKTFLAIIAIFALSVFAFAGTWNTQQIFHTTGGEDTELVGTSDNGASAGFVQQSVHFSSPAFVVQRTGTAGGEMATSGAFFVQTGQETSGTTPVMVIGGCAVTSGDNYIISFGDGSIQFHGGIRSYLSNQKPGKISIDPNLLQLVAEDGVTPVLSWSGSNVGIFHGSFRSNITTLATANRSVVLPDTSGTLAMKSDLANIVTLSGTLVSGSCTINNTGFTGKHPWLQSSGTNALGLTLSGTTAVIRSANTSDVSPFTLFFGNF